MRVVKAVVIREPLASRIAAGEESAAYKTFHTTHRGEILIVADREPWYGLALLDLVDVRPISPEDVGAPFPRGYVWKLRNPVPLTRFIAGRRSGLSTVEIPEGALPPGLREPVFEAPPSPPAASPEVVKLAMARELRAARAGLRTVARGFRELATLGGGGGADREAVSRFEAAALEILRQTEDLVADMVRLDPLFQRALAAPIGGPEQVEPAGWPQSLAPAAARRLDILVVEDEPKMARGLARSLSPDHDVRIAGTKREALVHIRDRVPDVLLCDHRLEWQKTDDLFEYVRDKHPRVRRVLYSFSHVEVWNDLLSRKLVDTVVPKSAPKNVLLAALT